MFYVFYVFLLLCDSVTVENASLYLVSLYLLASISAYMSLVCLAHCFIELFTWLTYRTAFWANKMTMTMMIHSFWFRVQVYRVRLNRILQHKNGRRWWRFTIHSNRNHRFQEVPQATLAERRNSISAWGQSCSAKEARYSRTQTLAGRFLSKCKGRPRAVLQ